MRSVGTSLSSSLHTNIWLLFQYMALGRQLFSHTNSRKDGAPPARKSHAGRGWKRKPRPPPPPRWCLSLSPPRPLQGATSLASGSCPASLPYFTDVRPLRGKKFCFQVGGTSQRRGKRAFWLALAASPPCVKPAFCTCSDLYRYKQIYSRDRGFFWVFFSLFKRKSRAC